MYGQTSSWNTQPSYHLTSHYGRVTPKYGSLAFFMNKLVSGTTGYDPQCSLHIFPLMTLSDLFTKFNHSNQTILNANTG